MCRDGVRKAEAKLELNWARNAKRTKKGFYRYVNQKRKDKKINSVGKLVTMDEEKAELLNRTRVALPRRILECCCMRGHEQAMCTASPKSQMCHGLQSSLCPSFVSMHFPFSLVADRNQATETNKWF